MKAGWPQAAARRIGLTGALDFTTTRVGQTLHIPCERGGHTVDITIRPGLDPNGVAKSLLSKGWTIGSKLTCPDCAKDERSAVARKRFSRQAAKKRWDGISAEERSAHAKMMAAARHGKHSDQSEENHPMNIVAATVADHSAPASDAAKRAKRLVYQALEDYYDDKAKRYRPGHSDESIAKETGASPVFVARIREEDFGPLGAPPELSELLEQMASYRGEVEAMCSEANNRLAAFHKKLAALAKQYGWAI